MNTLESLPVTLDDVLEAQKLLGMLELGFEAEERELKTILTRGFAVAAAAVAAVFGE